MIYFHCYTCKRDIDVSETVEERGTRYCASCDAQAEQRDTEKLSEEIAILREYHAIVEDLFSRVGPLCNEVGQRADAIAQTARNAMDLRVWKAADTA